MPPVSIDFHANDRTPGSKNQILKLHFRNQNKGLEFKITLFVDDIILTLTDPASSLVKVWEILNTFNACSFYKVNDSKSNVLGIHFAKSTK